MEIAIEVTGIALFTGGLVFLRSGGLTALLEAIGIWCLVRRDMRLAAQAAKEPSLARWRREVGRGQNLE